MTDYFVLLDERRQPLHVLEVGHGRIDEQAVRAALAGTGPALDGTSAPAKGLNLRRVAIGRASERSNGVNEER